jgi:hypothetical protein
MFQFVYVSSAVLLFSDEDLKNLLEVSRRRNQECGVTGLLLYVRGNFIQLLEGRQEDVLATRARIEADKRHRGIVPLLEGWSEKREFPDWSMGFELVREEDRATLPGLSDFLERNSDPSAQQSGALKLLEFFRELNVKK